MDSVLYHRFEKMNKLSKSVNRFHGEAMTVFLHFYLLGPNPVEILWRESESCVANKL